MNLLKKILILFSLSLLPLLLIPVYAESLPETIKASTHGYEIDFKFSNGKVSGTIISDTHTITLDNPTVIERKGGFLVFDKQNNLKILSKYVNQEKYLVIVKINSDDVKTKFRFLTQSNDIKPQRNLMDEFLQSQNKQVDIESMTHRELQNYLKLQEVNEILQKQNEIRKTNANDYTSGQSILDKFEKSKELTGLELIVPEVIETEIMEEPQYIPELIMASSHDFSTYWKENFNIDVQTYDKKINPTATGFEGKIDGIDITVTISLGDEIITTLKGITQYGEWMGEYYIKENLRPAGEYTVDVLATLNGQSVSKISSMFVIGTVGGSDSSNHAPVAVAGNDQDVNHSVLVTLDGSASTDSDGDTLTYSWTQTSGAVTQVLSDSTAISPTFNTSGADTYVFELTVTDPKGNSSTDSVSIVVA